MLKEVFGALHLYDLVELLERVTKPRTLHPALSLKEIENLQDASNRPTKFYSKAKVLIIHNDEGIVGNNAEKIGTFFKALNSQTQVTTLSMDPQKELLEELFLLRRETKQRMEPLSPWTSAPRINVYPSVPMNYRLARQLLFWSQSAGRRKSAEDERKRHENDAEKREGGGTKENK